MPLVYVTKKKHKTKQKTFSSTLLSSSLLSLSYSMLLINVHHMKSVNMRQTERERERKYTHTHTHTHTHIYKNLQKIVYSKIDGYLLIKLIMWCVRENASS